MLQTADVTRQFIQTIIEIIGRKTSDEYAAVTIRNLLKKLQPGYPLLRTIEIKNTRSVEMEEYVSVSDELNVNDPKDVGIALQELMKIIMRSLGKTAGYFFIRETREKIGRDYDEILVKAMKVDLTFMQSTYIIEKKSQNLFHIEKSDVVRRLLKVLTEVIEKQTQKTYALTFIKQHLDALRERYPFLKYVTINDIRYTLGSEEIAVQTEINTVNPQDLGKAIDELMSEIDSAFINLGHSSIINDVRTHLTTEYLAKLQEMGIRIIAHEMSYSVIFTEVIKTIVDVMGKIRTEQDAMSMVNSLLRKIEAKYPFLKQVIVQPAMNPAEPYHIILPNSIDSITETDARRALQHLLEASLDSLNEQASEEFIQEFKDSLDKKYFVKIEDMGVNFHMIELHRSMFT
jgi:hypothetical protein